MKYSHAWMQYFWERHSTMGPEHPCMFLLFMPKMQVPDESLSEPFLQGHVFSEQSEGWVNISPQKNCKFASVFYKSSETSSSLSCNTICCVKPSITGPLHCPCGMWGALGIGTNQHEALIIAFPVNNILWLYPRFLCLMPNQWKYSRLMC